MKSNSDKGLVQSHGASSNGMEPPGSQFIGPTSIRAFHRSIQKHPHCGLGPWQVLRLSVLTQAECRQGGSAAAHLPVYLSISRAWTGKCNLPTLPELRVYLRDCNSHAVYECCCRNTEKALESDTGEEAGHWNTSLPGRDGAMCWPRSSN